MKNVFKALTVLLTLFSLTGPVKVSREAHEGLIDLDTADAGAAAQGGVKHLNRLHFQTP